MQQPNPADRLHDLGAELVMYAGRLVRAVTRQTMPAVPAATLRLLALVEELEPVGISRLAAADRCSQPTMSAAVTHLTEKGWAAKRPHPSDARSTLVDLTEAGRDVLAAARRRNAEAVAARIQVGSSYDVEDLAGAVALLQHLLEDHPEGSRDLS